MKITENEINGYIEKYNYIFAIWTDKADFTSAPIENVEKLIEIRAFSSKNGEESEFHAVRSVIAVDFLGREIFDSHNCYDGFFDEEHYLDIDSKKTADQHVKITVGGGKYHLPDGVDADKIKIRFYIKYDAEGIARKADWRLVGFVKESRST